MGNNYPDVTPGQSVQHSARRENAISHLLKDANKFLEGRAKAHSPQSVRVPAYNASGDTILPGEAVQIDVTGNMSGPAFPVVAFDEDETDAPFGVFDRAVAENGMADLIVSGPATVQISGSSGSYAVPTDGGGFERGDEGLRVGLGECAGGGDGLLKVSKDALAEDVVAAVCGGGGIEAIVNLRDAGFVALIGADVEGLTRLQGVFTHQQGILADDGQPAFFPVGGNDARDARGVKAVVLVVHGEHHVGESVPGGHAGFNLLGDGVGLGAVADDRHAARDTQAVVGDVGVLLDIVLKTWLGNNGDTP